jgi:alkanesulfonate monooxygenase SsuD/methylene tetrahydromethanopterin reductase-like flavin-dependent oxidoreductase (luciferase family)
MKFGVVFPQTEYGNDPSAIRDYAQTVEGLGLSHVSAFEHVLGVNPERPDRIKGPYTYEHPFQSPFLLFSFMSAVTSELGFATCILILPQRQTALVAKQAATLDVLSQVELLRLLWTKPLVDFNGRWHTIEDAGLNPLPVQQPIPIWFGGNAEAVLKRIARSGDGWMPNYKAATDALPSLEAINKYLEEAGRSREEIGIEFRLPYGDGDPNTWTRTIREWQTSGATHMSFNTMGSGFFTPAEHLTAVRKFASVIGIN